MNIMRTFWSRSLIAALVAILCLHNGIPVGALANLDMSRPPLLAPTDLYSLDLQVDGIDDYASAPDSNSLDVGTGAIDDFTLETFFYVPDLTNTTTDTLFWKNGAYGLYILYYTAQADRFIFRINTDPTNYVYMFYNVDLGTGWHHVAAVFDNEYTASQDQMALYLDGNLAISSTAAEWTPGLLNSSSALNLGGYSGINSLNGWMEETRISNSVRYSGSTYTVPTTPFASDGNTNALWHFDDGWDATTFSDGSGNGNTLTGQNGARVGNPTGTPPVPGDFGKSAPADDAVGQSTSPTLVWNAGSGADNYEYCYDTSDNNTCNGTWTSTGLNIWVDLSGLAINTTYSWQVRAVNTSGSTEANAGNWWLFTTTAGAPGAFNKSTPGDGASGQSLDPMLSWNASAGAASYEVCYDTSDNSTCNATWIPNGTDTSIGVNGLVAGTTYYWQVRALNENGSTLADEGSWWSFTTLSIAPSAFGKLSPADGAQDQSTNPTLSWAASTGAASYEYCYDTSANSTCNSAWTSTASTSANLGGLSLITTYYWQVRAINASGTTYADGGTWWSFTTSSSETGQPGPTYTVNSTAHANDGVCGVEHCTLWEALDTANADGVPNTIELQADTIYTLTQFVSAERGQTGLPAITSEITLNGHNAIIQRDPTYPCIDDDVAEATEFRIFYITSNSSLTLNDLTIRHGCASGPLNNYQGYGGGIFKYHGSLSVSNGTIAENAATHGGGIAGIFGAMTLTESTITGNSSTYGGGVYVEDSMTITNSYITENTASNFGGGVSVLNSGQVTLNSSTISGNQVEGVIDGNGMGGGIFNNGDLTITDSIIHNNSANGYSPTPSSYFPAYGGGIESHGTLSLSNSTVSNNSAAGGAGIRSSGTLSLADCIFLENKTVPSYGWNGGGLQNLGTAVVNRCTFEGNTAAYGGGIQSESTITITDSSFTNNSASWGGAISSHGDLSITNSALINNSSQGGGALYTDLGVLSVTNVTFSGNSALYYGGAILAIQNYMPGSLSSLLIRNSTIANNIAGDSEVINAEGGGINNLDYQGTITLMNTILASNIDRSGRAPDCRGAISSQDYNLILDPTHCSFTPSAHDLTDTDPLLAPLANYGGLSPTHALPFPSPAIDKIPNGVNGCGAGLIRDQRGATRPIDGNNDGTAACDIGAYELDPWAIPGDFGKSSPGNSAIFQPTSLTLSWTTSADATSYEYCYDISNDNGCSAWINNGASTSATITGLTPGLPYYWQVRAGNKNSSIQANNGTWWSFSTMASASFFADIPANYWARSYIERLYAAGVTGGCSTAPLMYCPETKVNRAQMAIFLLRGKYGDTYTPPAATGTIFNDIPSNHWAGSWIEQLYAEGITGGCGNGNYCPNTLVTREQMAIFLLRAKYGNTYTPPPATGVFSDVPADYWAAAWIEQLAAEGITGGCGGGNYCPKTIVNRAQMAVFLVKTFALP